MNSRTPYVSEGAASILALIAADANVSPAFAAAIAKVGSERWNEVRDQETADQRADERREELGLGEYGA